MTQETDQTFVSAALEFFARLLDEGYAVTDVRSSRVEYGKRGRRIVVCRNARSGEIDVSVGTIANPFSIDEYMRYCVGDGAYVNDGAVHRNDIRQGVAATAQRLFAHPELLVVRDLPEPIKLHVAAAAGASGG